ncbi:hypothetical protein EV426DRAFT_546389, partial [Tirmania nivea]
MASSSSTTDADLSQLTPSQQEALQQFTAVTAQQPSAALPILHRSQWNVQIAIAKFFDGETTDPAAETLAAQASSPSSPTAHPTTTSSSSSSSSSPSRRRSSTSIHPAPRVVPTPTTLLRRNLLLSILFLPFSLLYRLFTTSFHLFTTLFPFLRPLTRHFIFARSSPPRRRTTSPRDTSARFIREFEESTGVKDLPWFEGGYAQAMDLAKKDMRIMMVVLQSEEHDDTHVFNKETLGNSEVITWLREKNIVLWGGSVGDSEGYQVAASLLTTAFPFLALISLTPPSAASSSSSTQSASAANGGTSPTTMSTILRISGLLPPQTLLQKLNTALSAHADSLDRIRAIRDTHLADRQLREQQNSAYEISLARDRERARLRREEEARRKAAEEEARRRESLAERIRTQKKAWRTRQVRLGLLPPEPAPDVKAARVSIRFPDGEKVSRRFERGTGMEGVYAWVECRGVEVDPEVDPQHEEALLQDYSHTYAFRLVNPLPRKVFMCGEGGGTVGEHLWPSGNLIVEEGGEGE